jgi:hypothetical protein
MRACWHQFAGADEPQSVTQMACWRFCNQYDSPGADKESNWLPVTSGALCRSATGSQISATALSVIALAAIGVVASY